MRRFPDDLEYNLPHSRSLMSTPRQEVADRILEVGPYPFTS